MAFKSPLTSSFPLPALPPILLDRETPFGHLGPLSLQLPNESECISLRVRDGQRFSSLQLQTEEAELPVREAKKLGASFLHGALLRCYARCDTMPGVTD